ncbi:hypothetical protein L7F22_067756 [Adiantum nelumboides]|nr:hypothetical protein [Adiantum nelumboides]
MAKSCLVREILHVLAIGALFHQLLLATNAVPVAEWSQVDVSGHDCLQNTLHGPACLQEIALERAQTSAAGELESAEYNSDTQEINMVDMPVDIATSLAASPLVFQTYFSILTPCLTTPTIRPRRGHERHARLVVAVPTSQSGTYPVILFKHGFALANCFYTQLFQYLASSGFIVVAPQAVTLNIDMAAEIKETAEVANWIL